MIRAEFSRQSEVAVKRSAVSDRTADLPVLLESALDVAVKPCSSVGRNRKVPILTPGAAKGSSSGLTFCPSIDPVRSWPGSSFCLSTLSMVTARRLPPSSPVASASA